MALKKKSLLKLSGFKKYAVWSILIGSLVLGFYVILSLRFDLKKIGDIPERSVVFDKYDKVYSRLHGENRIVVTMDQIPKSFVQALLAREDTRFYHHHGVDFLGIARAMVHNVVTLSIREGASTLTQQLARNSFLLGGHNLHRKLLEAVMAYRIEYRYSKREILESYINRIYYGSGVYGLEAASQLYFEKPCSELTLSESAMLVGLIRSPNRFSPFNNLKGSIRERNDVLNRMVEVGMISKDEAAKAKNSKVKLARKRTLSVQENYAMDAVQRVLGLLLTPEQFEQGGLKIYTTIDPELQKAAARALDQHLTEIENEKGYPHARKAPNGQDTDLESPTEYVQGALVAIDNRTGGICAIVGGRDYRQSKFNRAMQARRQIGSSFKPFVYTAAFEAGLRPDTPIEDSALQPGEIAGASPTWMPANSDEHYTGEQPAEYGLIHSRNTMSIRVGDRVGLQKVRSIAEMVGLCNDIPRVPSIYLGGFEASPKDVTTAYTIFPNHGKLKQSFLIRKIEDADGGVLYEATPSERDTFDPDAVQTTNEILQKVMSEGTGSSARQLGFDKPAGGKTGTTNGYRDAWFVGYTTSLTCGVWVGFDHPQTIMSRGYGAVLALPVWADFMNSAPESEYPAESLGGGGVQETVTDVFRSIRDFFGGGRKEPKEREQEKEKEKEQDTKIDD